MKAVKGFMLDTKIFNRVREGKVTAEVFGEAKMGLETGLISTGIR